MAKSMSQDDRLKYQKKKKKTTKGIIHTKFPKCIGMFPECKDYNTEMKIEERIECQKCPFK
jgi:hypothetical protein